MTWPCSSCREEQDLPGDPKEGREGTQGPLAPEQEQLRPAVLGPRRAQAQHPMGVAMGLPCIYQLWTLSRLLFLSMFSL